MNTLRILAAGLLLLCSPSLSARHTLRLAELNPESVHQSYGTAQLGRSVTGRPATVGGEAFTDVIGTHAPSVLRLDLHRTARSFRARVGIADNDIDYAAPSGLSPIALTDGSRLWYATDGDTRQFVGLARPDGTVGPGSVRFVVRGDGCDLYDSGILHAGDAPKSIELDLTGISRLELAAEPTDDGPSGDHALWIAPQIDYDGDLCPEAIAADSTADRPNTLTASQEQLLRQLDRLPVLAPEALYTPASYDWLLDPSASRARLYATPDRKGLILANDLVARVFRIVPNLATTDIVNRMTGESLIRAVSGEGTLTLDGREYPLGGLDGQPERGYLDPKWLDRLTSVPGSFTLEAFEFTPDAETLPWNRNRWALNTDDPTGTTLTFTLRGPDELEATTVRIAYTLYDRVPVVRKRFTLHNGASSPVTVDRFRLEQLAFAEPESPGGGDPTKFRLPNIHIESDYACGGEFFEPQTDITERWVEDPRYTSQRNYNLQTLCILEVAPPLGPAQTILPGETFRSFAAYEMPFDSDDRERKGLFKRRMYRTLTPWVTQNPIFMHLTSSDPEVIRRAVDQCDSTGYEMIIISFGSGLNAEDTSTQNIEKWKTLVDYAAERGIEMGCYSLLASRWISDSVDIINPATGRRGGAKFGSSPCLSSEWGHDYFAKIRTFFEKTGMRCFEHDGSYPGDFCASTAHAYHRGLDDSQWNQFRTVTDLYHWMCSRGIYINVPDFYFLNGSTKTGIGYRETNWSLPRDRQIIHARQLNYDCTWDRPASACWSFVPLVEYQGGGAAATLEPLSDHLYEYKTHMVQNYGAGVQACYRGPRLYDTPATKEAVTEVIDWYKRYRRILNSDIIHLRRPDAREWDGLLHVDPSGPVKGLAMFFNPTDRAITRTIRLPLYYTGLTSRARIREAEGPAKSYRLDREYRATLHVTIPARGYTWYTIE